MLNKHIELHKDDDDETKDVEVFLLLVVDGSNGTAFMAEIIELKRKVAPDSVFTILSVYFRLFSCFGAYVLSLLFGILFRQDLSD
jgi:hypothetical protein